MSNSPPPPQIKELRAKHGLSTQNAAMLIGCSTRAWLSWESGQRNMPVSKYMLAVMVFEQFSPTPAT
jgi:DNA-binding transcriptional regulator YiaG